MTVQLKSRHAEWRRAFEEDKEGDAEEEGNEFVIPPPAPRSAPSFDPSLPDARLAPPDFDYDTLDVDFQCVLGSECCHLRMHF